MSRIDRIANFIYSLTRAVFFFTSLVAFIIMCVLLFNPAGAPTANVAKWGAVSLLSMLLWRLSLN